MFCASRGRGNAIETRKIACFRQGDWSSGQVFTYGYFLDVPAGAGSRRLVASRLVAGEPMMMSYNRRQALTIGVGAAALAVLGLPTAPAFAKNNSDDLISKFTGGK